MPYLEQNKIYNTCIAAINKRYKQLYFERSNLNDAHVLQVNNLYKENSQCNAK